MMAYGVGKDGPKKPDCSARRSSTSPYPYQTALRRALGCRRSSPICNVVQKSINILSRDGADLQPPQQGLDMVRNPPPVGRQRT
jgi:hypothetical protein